MIRQIKTAPVVGDIVELRNPVCESTWRMKITEMKGAAQFIGQLVYSTYPSDEVGSVWRNEYLRDYFKI